MDVEANAPIASVSKSAKTKTQRQSLAKTAEVASCLLRLLLLWLM